MGEPADVRQEQSASACFQWGVLNSSQGRRDQAITWLKQAVWLDWSNYWYQFYLAYLEDQAGSPDDALDHYGAAVALQPNSAWVRFSRARLYRTKGLWSWALSDLERARSLMGESPESLQVALELGVLHQALGDFSSAAREYETILSKAPTSPYARAARLNQANLDAESGRPGQALSAYEALLQTDPRDQSARLSRALLNLRMGEPKPALADLDLLLETGVKLRKRDEVLATAGRGQSVVPTARSGRRRRRCCPRSLEYPRESTAQAAVLARRRPLCGPRDSTAPNRSC